MIIREFDVTPCTMRKEDPTWRFALAASPVTDGHVAAHRHRRRPSRASATPRRRRTWARPRTRSQAELELFRPLLIGKDPRDIEAILVELDRALRGAPQAKAAIDCALHDLHGARARRAAATCCSAARCATACRSCASSRSRRRPRWRRRRRSSSTRAIAISRSRCTAMSRRTSRASRPSASRSATTCISPSTPTSPIRPRTPSRRSTAWRSTASIWSSSRCDADDFEGLALVTRTVPVTVEADEAAGSLREIFELVSQRAVDAVSLKIPKLGGLRNTLAAARLCEAAHIKYRLGAAVGSRAAVGAGAASRLRAAGRRLCLRARRVRPPARRSVRGARGRERRAQAAAGCRLGRAADRRPAARRHETRRPRTQPAG